jgi:hypothetical protein
MKKRQSIYGLIALGLGAGSLVGRIEPAIAQLPAPNPSMEQVTSVSQLGDVQPQDWAFQALQSLVERYGCCRLPRSQVSGRSGNYSL